MTTTHGVVLMPPITRIQRAHDTARWIKVLTQNAAKADGQKSASAFLNVIQDMKIAMQQIDDLRYDTDRASDGYTTVKATRKALHAAAGNLEHIHVVMGETLALARDPANVPNMFYDRMRWIADTLMEVRFGPPIPRARITKEERARMDVAETSAGEAAYTADSNVNTLRDDEKKALDDLFK